MKNRRRRITRRREDTGEGKEAKRGGNSRKENGCVEWGEKEGGAEASGD